MNFKLYLICISFFIIGFKTSYAQQTITAIDQSKQETSIFRIYNDSITVNTKTADGNTFQKLGIDHKYQATYKEIEDCTIYECSNANFQTLYTIAIPNVINKKIMIFDELQPSGDYRMRYLELISQD